jgi:hypothetical protein
MGFERFLRPERERVLASAASEAASAKLRIAVSSSCRLRKNIWSSTPSTCPWIARTENPSTSASAALISKLVAWVALLNHVPSTHSPNM